MIQTRVIKNYLGEGRLLVHETELPGPEARLAMELVSRWGTVAGAPDGEDSAGRFKVRLMTPDELASRACEASAVLFAEIRRRGWMVATPDISELELPPENQD